MSKLINKDSLISFNRRFGGDDEGYITIIVQDSDSVSSRVEVKISLENFAKSITGISDVRCVASWHVDKLGKKREIKDEWVIEQELDQYKVDGWEYCHGLNNHHRKRNSDGSYLCVFERWV